MKNLTRKCGVFFILNKMQTCLQNEVKNKKTTSL